MMALRPSSMALLSICLLLSGWSAQGAVMQQGVRTQSSEDSSTRSSRNSADDDDDEDTDGEGNEEDNQAEEDDKDKKVASTGGNRVNKAISDGQEEETKTEASSSTDDQEGENHEEDDADEAASSHNKVHVDTDIKRPVSIHLDAELQVAEPAWSPGPAPAGIAKTDVQLLEEALATSKHEQHKLKKSMEHVSDAAKSAEEIDASVDLVANETDSPGLASMMGEMWTEMRMFNADRYRKHVLKKLKKMEHDQHSLEKQLAVAKGEPYKQEEKEEAEGESDSEKDSEKLIKAEEAVGDSSEKALAAFPSGRSMIFWEMSPKRQESFLAGSFVYLVAGIALAFLYNKARFRHKNAFAVAPRPEAVRNPKSFSFSMLGCLSTPNICLMGFCCPCLRWADTVDRIGFLPYWKAFFAFFILQVLYGLTWGIAPICVVALGVYYRQKFRAKYDFENGTMRSVAVDTLAWLCCQPCAIIQEAREESIMLEVSPGWMSDDKFDIQEP